MSAPKGNKYYMNRQKNGRELIFSSPEELLEKCYPYFEWCDKNPWIKKDVIRSGVEVGKLIDIPTQRPYTIEGLCVHIGINRRSFDEYNAREDFFPVTTHVREIIEANQLEGAVVGAYNHNIIARKLGLTEKVDVTGEINANFLLSPMENKTIKLTFADNEDDIK
ncbi:MAG: DNA-packaging protein [Candidatus Azobacteroides sp.]|nr:DNA-packaging protein [Candidatus Azobacteroides sp.]